VQHTFIGVSEKGLKQFISFWNSNFPLDFWWRQKHNIPFNSPSHCTSSFIDQVFEYYEEESYNKITLKSIEKKKEVYQPGRMNWLKPKIFTESEIQNMFDNLNLDEIDKT
jgi:hypothetical protein